MHTIYTRGAKDGVLRNPARSLYLYWLGIMKATYPDGITSGGFITLGQRQWGVGIDSMDTRGRPVFALGPVTGYGGVSTRLLVAADGRFRVMYLNPDARTGVSSHSFLSWVWLASRHQWGVDLDHACRWQGAAFEEWQRPREYVPERVLITNWYLQRSAHWLALERAGEDWRIVPARNQSAPNEDKRRTPSRALLHEFAESDRLRLRRYRLAERAWRLANGEIPSVSAGPGKVTLAGREIDREEAVLQIIAMLDVTTPAKTTPLRKRPEEALHGNNLVTTHDV